MANSSLTSTVWTWTNFSTEDVYDLGYTVRASVTTATVPYTPVGSVDARVDFVLPIYAGSPSGPTDTVAIGVLVSNWPWQASGDHLILTLGAWPSFAGAEHLVLGSSPGSLLSSVSSSSGAALEQLGGSTSAVANPGSGSSANISATASAVGNSSEALISVAFGASSGEFTAVSYSASVHVLFPASVAGIPTVDLVAVGGVAALIAALVAVGARQVRRRPSDLTYVDEEDS